MRYYYKTEDGKGLLSLKSPYFNSDYIQITEDEFNALAGIEKPVASNKLTDEEKAYISEHPEILEEHPELADMMK